MRRARIVAAARVPALSLASRRSRPLSWWFRETRGRRAVVATSRRGAELRRRTVAPPLASGSGRRRDDPADSDFARPSRRRARQASRPTRRARKRTASTHLAAARPPAQRARSPEASTHAGGEQACWRRARTLAASTASPASALTGSEHARRPRQASLHVCGESARQRRASVEKWRSHFDKTRHSSCGLSNGGHLH